ncbi:MAG: ACP S-malonyltransferase, partial [Rhodospirillaceae bacterium]|nr:ACP S-malonyltransferase [Rhodospirillaceae bacterium]
AAKLLRTRGQAMQKAVPVGAGDMAAQSGLDWDSSGEVCTKASSDTDVCSPANDNAPGQVVISGAKVAVERAAEIAKEMGAKRAIMLPVSAPFHCSMMSDAADVMAGALAEADIKSPIVPVIANITAEPVSNPDEIRDLLVRQVTGMVRWRESVLTLKSLGINQLVEVGAGKVLSGLVRRIDKELTGVSICTPEDIDAFIESL